MVKIAVCEDNPITRRLIVEMINNIKSLTVFTISQFSSKADFNDDEPLNSDIILMSGDFNSRYGTNGFEITKSLRKKGCNANIIFITSFSDNVYQSFELKPFRCILKPASFEELEESITSSINYLASSSSIQIKINHSNVTLNLNDIIYLESDKRYINIRTVNNTYVAIEKLGTFEEMLSNRSFFRTHRTYIVNFKHISNINNPLIEMKNGECVILSRQKKAAFDDAYTNFLKQNFI